MTTKDGFDWSGLQTFLALYRNKTLAKAARDLAVDKATASRHLAALEAALGAPLFTRSKAGLVPTELAKRALFAAQEAESAAFSFMRQVRGGDPHPRGTVRVTSGELLGPLFLVPALADLVSKYPELRVEVEVNMQTANLARQEADIAVRLYRPKEENLLVQSLGSHSVGLFASVTYLSEFGTPRNLRALERHRFIAYDTGMAHLPESQWLARNVASPRTVFASNSSRAILDACVAALGIAVLPHYAAALYPNLGEVMRGSGIPDRPIWLVRHPEVLKTKRIHAVAAFLIDLFRTEARRLRASDAPA